MSGHTPGPWKWRNHKGSITKCELVGANGTVICVAESVDGGVPADDELIAASPELLEALKLAESAFWGTCESEGQEQAITKIRAAIAKATGETHETPL